MSDHKYVVAQTQDVVLSASVVVFPFDDTAAFARYRLNKGDHCEHLRWQERKAVFPNQLCVTAEKNLIDRVGQCILREEARPGEVIQFVCSTRVCELFPASNSIAVMLDKLKLAAQWASVVAIFSRVGWASQHRKGIGLTGKPGGVEELVNGGYTVNRCWGTAESPRAKDTVIVIGRIDFDTNTLLSITRAPESGEPSRQTWACFKDKLPMTAGSVPVPPGTTTFTGKAPEVTPTFIDGLTVDECLQRYEEAMASEGPGVTPLIIRVADANGEWGKALRGQDRLQEHGLTIAQLKAAQGAWSEKLKKLVETAAQKRKKDKIIYVQPEYDPWD